MLPRQNRLNLKTDFKWVVSGKRLDTKYITLFIKIGENEKPRIGIALSGKNFKKAIERNRAKRLTAQAFQTLILNLPSNINIVALPKAGILSVKSSELFPDLETVLQNEKIIS